MTLRKEFGESIGVFAFDSAERIVDESGISAMANRRPVDPKILESYKRQAQFLSELQAQKRELVYWDAVEQTVIGGTSAVLTLLPAGGLIRVPQKVMVGPILLEGVVMKGSVVEGAKKAASLAMGLPVVNYFAKDFTEGIAAFEKLEKQQFGKVVQAAEALKADIKESINDAEHERKALKMVDDQVERLREEQIDAGKAFENAVKGLEDFLKRVFNVEEKKMGEGKVSAQAAKAFKALTVQKAGYEDTVRINRVKVQQIQSKVNTLEQNRHQMRARVQQADGRTLQLARRPTVIQRVSMQGSPVLKGLVQQVFHREQQEWQRFEQLHRSLFGQQPIPMRRYLPPPLHSPAGKELIQKTTQHAVQSFMANVRYVRL